MGAVTRIRTGTPRMRHRFSACSVCHSSMTAMTKWRPWDSNPHFTRSERALSADWSTSPLVDRFSRRGPRLRLQFAECSARESNSARSAYQTLQITRSSRCVSCAPSDSNRNYAVFKSAASANWATCARGTGPGDRTLLLRFVGPSVSPAALAPRGQGSRSRTCRHRLPTPGAHLAQFP